MKSFRCGDVIPGCDEVMTGTEQEILEQVARHAQEVHGLDAVPDSLVPVIVQKITEVH